jgi:hypothetical protein
MNAAETTCDAFGKSWTVLKTWKIGSGPDWDCISIPQGDAICMRKLP